MTIKLGAIIKPVPNSGPCGLEGSSPSSGSLSGPGAFLASGVGLGVVDGLGVGLTSGPVVRGSDPYGPGAGAGVIFGDGLGVGVGLGVAVGVGCSSGRLTICTTPFIASLLKLTSESLCLEHEDRIRTTGSSNKSFLMKLFMVDDFLFDVIF